MNKQEILDEIKSLAARGEISEGEVLAAYRGAREGKNAARLGISEVLYYIGGAIVCIGIGIFLYQNWSDLNSVTRIAATLGSSLAAYVVAVLFMKYKRMQQVSDAFFLIAGVVAPIGLGVTFHEAGIDVGNARMQAIMSLILLVYFLASYLLFRKVLLALFSVIFGTWAYFSVVSWVMGSYPVDDQMLYVILAAGLAYLFLGYGFAARDKLKVLTGYLYGLGLVAVLGSAMALGKWTPNQNVFWEVIFPGLALGAAFLGVYLKSRPFLAFGSLFLMGYIIKITAEYFSNTLGWPLALIICGLAMIAIGFGTFYVNRKYLAGKTA